MICPQCGKEFDPTSQQKSRQKKGIIISCSRKCAGKLSNKAHTKTHCKRGHELTPENRIGKVGQCRKCVNEAKRAKYVPSPLIIKTHCINGHKRIPENLGTKGNCLICETIRRKNKLSSDKEYKATVNERSRKWQENWRLNNPILAKEKGRARYLMDPIKLKEGQLKWKLANPDKYKKSRKRRKLKSVVDLQKSYIREKLRRIGITSPSDELIELQREKIQYNRFIRSSKKVIKEKENVNISCNA